jgi:hypothetical protein
VQTDPVLHAFYVPFAQKRGVRVRAMAISDWFNAPKVEAVDLIRYRGRAGDPIAIRATDAFGVVRVEVNIKSKTGRSIKNGLARLAGKSWRYSATQTLPKGEAVTIHVAAYDRPDHPGEMKVTWPAAG